MTLRERFDKPIWKNIPWNLEKIDLLVIFFDKIIYMSFPSRATSRAQNVHHIAMDAPK